jgi:methyl-accepting chemotaxis protein
VTQQNAALVEEAAAAAESMQGQSETLKQAVSFFKLEVEGGSARTANPAKPVAKPVIARQASTSTLRPRKERRLIKAQENKDGEWKEF